MLLTVATLRLQNCKSCSPSRDDSSDVSPPDMDLAVRWWEKSLGEVGDAGIIGGLSRRHMSQRQPRLALPLGCFSRLSKMRIQSYYHQHKGDLRWELRGTLKFGGWWFMFGGTICTPSFNLYVKRYVHVLRSASKQCLILAILFWKNRLKGLNRYFHLLLGS